MILLKSTLVEKKACNQQVELFSKMFGEEVDITVELCEKVYKEFSWGWASENLLSAPALEEYNKATAPALEEYYKVTTPAWEEYIKVRAPVWEEYKKAKNAAWEDYNKVRAPVWEEYKKVEAREFAKGYNKQGKV